MKQTENQANLYLEVWNLKKEKEVFADFERGFAALSAEVRVGSSADDPTAVSSDGILHF